MAFDFPASPSVDQDYVAGTVTYTYNGTGWVLKGTSTGQFVSKSGDTMTGDLTISKTQPRVFLNKIASGEASGIIGRLNGLSRWAVQLGDGTLESAGNVGSNFAIIRFDDAGNSIFPYALTIDRANSNAALNAATPSTSPTTGALTVAGGVGVSGAINTAGDLTISRVSPTLNLDKPVTNEAAILRGKRAGVNRWGVVLGSAHAETGSANTGSDFEIIRSTDAGAFNAVALSISRSTGDVSVGAATASTSPTTGALVVTGGVGISGEIRTAGNITVEKANASLVLTKAASGQAASIYGKTGVNIRWLMELGSAAVESGSDTGSNFGIYRYNDAGASQIAFVINRTTGMVSVTNSLASTSRTTGALVVAGGVGVSGNIFMTGEIQIRQGNDAYPLPGGGAICIGFGTVGISTRGQNDSGTWHCEYENISGVTVGNVTTTATTTSYNTSSDERLKEDLKPFDAGNIIDNTIVHDFRWKSTGERAIGVIAQEAEKIYPQAVTHSEEFNWWGIDYSKYVPLLLQELKSVRNRLNQLEDK